MTKDAPPRRWRRADLAWLTVVVATAILHWPTPPPGWVSDDFAQQAMLHGVYPGASAPWDLFRFYPAEPESQRALAELGILPWWMEPTSSGSVFRPLASLSLWLDHRLAPRDPGAALIHSWLWITGLVLGATVIARGVLGPGWAAVVALAVGLDPALAVPSTWIANRCAAMAALFALLTLAAHHRALERGDPRGWAWVWLATAGALGCGEYGLAVAGLVLGDLVLRRRFGGPIALGSLAGIATLCAAYVGLHRALGHGTDLGAVYVDPLRTPWHFLALAPGRLERMVTTLVLGDGPGWGHGGPWRGWAGGASPAPAMPRVDPLGPRWIWLGATALGLYVARRLAKPWLERAELERGDRLLVGALLGLAPTVATAPHPRLGIVVMPWVTIGLATWARGLARALGELRARPGARGRRIWGVTRGVAAAALLCGGALGQIIWAYQRLVTIRDDVRTARCGIARGIVELRERAGDLSGREVFVLNTLDHSLGVFGRFALPLQGAGQPKFVRSLAMSAHPLFVQRRSDRVLEISKIGGRWVEPALERLFQRPEPRLGPGWTWVAAKTRIEVLAAEAGFPTTIALTLSSSADDPHRLWLVGTSDGLRELTMPPIGGQLVVPRPALQRCHRAVTRADYTSPAPARRAADP